MKKSKILLSLLIAACSDTKKVTQADPMIPIESEINVFMNNYYHDIYLVEKEYEDLNPRRFSDTCKLVPQKNIEQAPPYYENCKSYDSITDLYFDKLRNVSKKYWDTTSGESIPVSLSQPAVMRSIDIKKIYLCQDSTIKVLANSESKPDSDYDFVMEMRGKRGNRKIFHWNLALGYSGANPFQNCDKAFGN